MTRPCVSIITPVFNMESCIHKCLLSIISQTYEHLEIILVNDGSTDNSPKIIDEYAARDGRIVALHKENGGIGSAYNAAFKIMTGDYVLFVDSDDWLELDAVESLVNHANLHEADVVYFGSRGMSVEGNEVETLNLNIFNGQLNETSNILKRHFEEIKHPSLCRLFKKELFTDIVVFEQNIGIDEMLTPQLLLKCKRAFYTSKSFYNVLIRSNSICRATYNDLKVNQTIKVYDFLMELFEKNLSKYHAIMNRKCLDVLLGIIAGFNKQEYLLSDYNLKILKHRVLKCTIKNLKNGHSCRVSFKQLVTILVNLFVPLFAFRLINKFR